MKYSYEYYCARGSDLDECCFLGIRYLTKYGFQLDMCDSWVLRSTAPSGPGKAGIRPSHGAERWFTGLWRSPADRLYVVESMSRIRTCDMPGMGTPASWQKVDFPTFHFRGVWGIDDRSVFASGTKKTDPAVLFWNGTSWNELPPPPGEIVWMHGLSPDAMYGVGAKGLIARWDGSAWTKIPIPSQEFLTSVWVAGADEMYAVGHGGVLWEGSSTGWGKVAEGTGPFYGVAKFGEDVFVGAKEHGILKRTRDRLECVNPEIHGQILHVGKALLISCPEEIAATSDGKTFGAKGRGSMQKVLDEKPTIFTEPDDDEDEEEEDASP
jgi:hypothetical protein